MNLMERLISTSDTIRWFEDLTRDDVASVGGKNSSLGEMIGNFTKQGIKVPPGFATTATAYRRFLTENKIDEAISGMLERFQNGASSLSETGQAIRGEIVDGQWPDDIAAEIAHAYHELEARFPDREISVAVRSSATAEDLPDASFAGQQESFLNVSGEDALLDACRRCFASLYTNRAIAYREAKGFDHQAVALSVGVQLMIRSDLAGAGVMFSIDTETGFDRIVLINAAWGLGENVVQGSIEPDEYQVFKPLLDDHNLTRIVEKRLGAKQRKLIYSSGDDTTRNVAVESSQRTQFVLSDEEILQLGRWAVLIERHYGCPMDMEWAKNGPTGELFIVQARPETVQGRQGASSLSSYTLGNKGRILTEGAAIGSLAAGGPVCIIKDASDIDRFVPGSILVTGITDPDWVPVMKCAAAIVTDHGGRTSHAAIVSRELGLPAIVGCGDATRQLANSNEVTVSCAEGDRGFVYEGLAEIREGHIDLSAIPKTETQVMLNLADATAAYRWWKLPADGVGLTRMEFVISHLIKAHPMALLKPQRIKERGTRKEIERLTKGFADNAEYFIDKLARGLARIAALLHPKPTIIRFSDFKTNEYADLVGGHYFEPAEENPMLGFRGASRYISPQFREAFALECHAIRRLREELGFNNVAVMIPFCRTVSEADLVLKEMAKHGLERGRNGLKVLVMCEVPSNVVLAGEFSKRFDGFSIGSNDLTQLVLGIDRDSELLADQFDARDPAVKWMIAHVIRAAHEHDTPVGLCGQAPSDHPDFAEFLVSHKINSISVTPDSFVAIKQHVARAEARGKA